MRNYRLVLLLKSGLKKEDKEKLITNVKKWVGEVKEDNLNELGEKKLSYPIKKERKAEYLVLNFQAATIASDLDKRLVMQDDIIRHMLVRD